MSIINTGTRIIPIGCNCNVTFLNKAINIKNKTGVFEYFQSTSLKYVTNVINTITENPNANIVNEGIHPITKIKCVYLLSYNFYSYHYKLNEYKSIFYRRYERFLNKINSSEKIFFIRVNPNYKCTYIPNYEKTTKKEILSFIDSIKKINRNIKINFLLIDTIDSKDDIKNQSIDLNVVNVNFFHKFFLSKDVLDEVCKESNPTINKYYLKILQDVGLTNV